ncbi:MAG: carbon-nitrogen hydrolase family protein [Betaproteobacteria bacterium]|nr:carbon-nitrogen hydrolase family protein [Betaproteobacteria bacterium]
MKPRNARLAAIQMVSGSDVARNLADAALLIAEAVEAGAELVGLPEYFPIIGADDALLAGASEPFGRGKIQDWLRETAALHGVWLLAGSIPLCSDVPERVFNSTLVVDPEGEVRARYDKIHLFSFAAGEEQYNESACILPGQRKIAFDSPFGRIGLSICYDLRFPELYRALAASLPLDLIFLPAAFTRATGRAHWEILVRARAIENQCYLLAAAQGGKHESGRRTYGNSMIIDPWGEVVARRESGQGIALADLDHQRIAEVRQKLPALSHRKGLADGN